MSTIAEDRPVVWARPRPAAAGFRVRGPEGDVGTVVGAVAGAVVVASGLFRRRLDLVPLDDVVAVDAAARTITVAVEPRPWAAAPRSRRR